MSGASLAPAPEPEPGAHQDLLVSVLVPTWNYRAYLGACLDSVLSQTYEGIEVIVVDDCSTDGSFDIARRVADGDSRVTLLRNETNLGAFRNSGRCIEHASGSALMFVGADDVLHPDAVSSLVRAIGATGETVMSFGNFVQIDRLGKVISRQAPSWLWQSASPAWAGVDAGNEMLRRCRNLIGSPTAVLFRKDALETWGALPGSPPGRQPLFDLLWWLRILRRGSVARVDSALSQRRLHPGSTTKSLGAHALLLTAWDGLLRYGVDSGYLSDAASESEAWSSFLLLNLGLLARPAHWRGSSPFVPRLLANAHEACERLSVLAGRAQTERPVGASSGSRR